MNLRRRLPLVLLVLSGVSARAEIFYTVEENGDVFCTIDTATGVLTPIGSLGSGYAFGDLAYDPSTGTMYMTDGWGQGIGSTSSLYTVDLTTGLATFVGSMGVGNVFGLVYDPQTNRLYGSSATFAPLSFYEIDRATGLASHLGDTGQELDGLAYVGSTGVIAGLSAGQGSIHSIDRSTGATTLLTPGGGFVNNCGIAWSPSSNRVYAIDWSGKLYAYDVGNGWSRTLVHSGLPPCDGLAAVLCPPPSVHCTAGTTTNGCVPSISSSGTPAAGLASGFVITATGIEGQKTGLLFYGFANPGFTPVPWAAGSSSFLCVKAPTQRTTTQATGGSIGACDGSLSLDWLAYIAANPGALGSPVSAGQTHDAQVWFRDPPAPKTTNLTNAIEWVVCP